MKQTLGKLARRLTQRKRTSWDEVPTLVLMGLGLCATMEASFYGYVFQKFAPDFLDYATAQPMATWLDATFVACVMILSVIGLQFFIWSVAAAGSAALLQKRYFSV